MTEDELKAVAAQLRQPHGEHAAQVAEMMNEGNRNINLNTIEVLQGLDQAHHLLEIGMGNGHFVQDVLAIGSSVRYTGCDYSPEMVAEARERNAKYVERGQAEFCLGQADQLPFDNEQFDAAFSINTVYFWEQPQEVLTELARVLKADGHLLLAIRPKSQMQHYPFTGYGFTLYEPGELAALVETGPFEVVDTLEMPEPDRELDGANLPMSTVIVHARKKQAVPE